MNEGNHRYVAHGLVEQDGTYLILRRRHGRYLGGQWDIPGGSVEDGETLAEAAVRECMEETNLRTVVGSELSHYENRDTEGRDLIFHTVTFRLLVVDDDAPVRLSPHEHDEFRWMTPDNPDALPLVWHVAQTLDGLFPS